MAKTVKVEGRIFIVPDDATPDEIDSILKAQPEAIETFVPGKGVVPIEQAEGFGLPAPKPEEDGAAFALKAKRFVEDVGYPGLGAYIGGALGAPLGPGGVAAGALLGAGAGEAAKQISRQAFDPEAAPKTSEEAAANITTAGAFGTLQELGTMRRAAGLVKPSAGFKFLTEQQLAGREFNVPLTQAQQTQGTFRTAIESVLKKTLGTTGVFRKRLEIPQNQALFRAVDDIANQIASPVGTRAQLGLTVQQGLKEAHEVSSSMYDNALKTISSEGGSSLPINLERLKPRAQELVDSLVLPGPYGKALEGIESRSNAIGILKAFTKTGETKQVPTGILGPDGKPIISMVFEPRNLTFEDARRLRTQIFSLTNSGEINIGKGALKQFNHDLDQAMKQALLNSHRPELARLFENASSQYKGTQTLLDKQLIAHLAKSDQPEKIGEMLLLRGSETPVRELRSLLSPEKMKSVERGLWEALVTKATKSDVLIGSSFKREFDKLGPELQRTIWTSPEQLGKIRRFVKLADTANLEPSVGEAISSQRQSLLAFGQVAATRGTVIALVRGLAGQQQDASDFAMDFGLGASTVVAGPMFARLITRPGALDVVNKALVTPARSRQGMALAWRLQALLVAESLKQDNEDRQKK